MLSREIAKGRKNGIIPLAWGRRFFSIKHLYYYGRYLSIKGIGRRIISKGGIFIK